MVSFNSNIRHFRGSISVFQKCMYTSVFRPILAVSWRTYEYNISNNGGDGNKINQHIHTILLKCPNMGTVPLVLLT